MYKVIFEYADGRKGTCIENGTTRLFETKKAAQKFVDELNDSIDEEAREFFPVWRAVEAENTEPTTKKEIYTVYSPEGDMTFIMEDIYDADGEPLSAECVGWYHGEPDDESTQYFIGKLKAEYTMGREEE